MIGITIEFDEKLEKGGSDLVRYSITFSVFHGIKFFGWWVSKIYHGKLEKDGEHLTKSLIFFFQLLKRIRSVFNNFLTSYPKGP